MAIHVAIKHIKFFKCLEAHIPEHRPDEYTQQLQTKTAVIPLNVLPLNEQKYGDVVQILNNYVTAMEKAYEEAGVNKNDIPNIQIGGDQLTRERFSGAKLLRLSV
jgi:hypothetical protein